MAQQVIAPADVPDTSVENSRKKRGARPRVRSSFVAVNVLDSSPKRAKDALNSRPKSSQTLHKLWDLHSNTSRVP